MPHRIALDAFEDAERHFVQSITCPDSIDGRRRHLSSLRIAIVLAWVAAEQQTKAQLRELASDPGAPAPPEDLYAQIVYCLAARQALKDSTTQASGLSHADGDDERSLVRERAFHVPRWGEALSRATQLYPRSEFSTYRGMREDLTQLTERKTAACVAYCRGLMIEIAGEPTVVLRTSPLARHLCQ